MVHIDDFITALKVTWLRKMITHPDCSWSSLSNININRFFLWEKIMQKLKLRN